MMPQIDKTTFSPHC